MLTALSIRDFVLVRALDLELGAGFTALTGETGAGKSILLSALSFALGARGQQSLIRSGASSATVTASFEPACDHPVRALLVERGVGVAADEALVFRRSIKRGAGARAFCNDIAVSAALLEEAGRLLADVHGQHEGLGLLNPARHRALLDAYGQTADRLQEVGAAWTTWRRAETAREALEARVARTAMDRSWIAQAVAELDAIDPAPGEAARLALERAGMQLSERIAEAIASAREGLLKTNVESALANAGRLLARALATPQSPDDLAASGPGKGLRAASEALERAMIETIEATAALETAYRACAYAPDALEAAEARLFALRALARKHHVEVDQLAGLRQRLRLELDELEHGDGALALSRQAEIEARARYREAAARLSTERAAAARRLEVRVAHELRPLKLDKAQFRVRVASRDESEAGPAGLDDVAFEISTLAGAAFGPLNRIASGGELARFSLAISVCLAGSSPCATLVFDEADVGVGGAVAAAIGERLAQLGQARQVLAITHSPQVAAAATHQWRIAKHEGAEETAASVEVLAPKARREEIARMLSGASVTREARAAATRLLAGA